MKNKKLMIFFIACFFILSGFYFLLAISAPTNIYFSQNTSSNYDKEGQFNINWTGVSGAGNYTIYMSIDGGSSWFNSDSNDSSNGYFFNNASDANYTFRVESINATNSLDKANSSDISIIVDTTIPSLSYSTGTDSNNSGADRNWIFVNVSASDLHNDSLVFSLYNSSGLINQTLYSYSISEINWTGLSNAVYYFNVSANDSATNSKTLSTRTFYLDGTNPVISSFTLSDTSVNVDDSITSNCSATDNLDPSVSTSVTGIDTSSSGSKTAVCTATDKAGNSVNSSVSYTVSSSNTNNGGGGNNNNNNNDNFWTITYSEDDKNLQEKGIIYKELGEKQRIKLKIENETHYVGVINLTNKSVTINVSSTSQQEILDLNESHKFEVSGDNNYDFEVSYLNYNNASDKANLSIVFISEQVPEPVQANSNLNATQSENSKDSPKTKTNKVWLWILLILILIAIGIVISYFKKKKRHSEYGY